MQEDSHWDDNFDEDGTTLGPEEALHKEIEKSKSLKIERLQLKGNVEKLNTRIAQLTGENQNLKAKIQELQNRFTPQDIPPKGTEPMISAKWPLLLLIFNLLALGFLIYKQV
ncbi:MAG: hypothetical protein VX667_05785 [Nitrospinota bacterium]|nr:hypothetical protein [Nitrospinota bacterium]